MELIKGNKNYIYTKTARIIYNSIKELLRQKDRVILGVVGGRNVSVIFQELLKENIDWGKIHIFIVDERMVPIIDNESNYKLLKDNLIDKLPKKLFFEENVHPFEYFKGIEMYEKELKYYGGSFDIIILSSGEDGHIGGLYPNHPSIKDDSEFFITMNDSPKPPSNRMSSSRRLLLRSNIAFLMFIGEGKREAYNNFFDEKLSIINCPTKLVKKIPKYYILTDLED